MSEKLQFEDNSVYALASKLNAEIIVDNNVVKSFRMENNQVICFVNLADVTSDTVEQWAAGAVETINIAASLDQDRIGFVYQMASGTVPTPKVIHAATQVVTSLYHKKIKYVRVVSDMEGIFFKVIMRTASSIMRPISSTTAVRTLDSFESTDNQDQAALEFLTFGEES